MIYAILAILLFVSGMATGYKVTEWKEEASQLAAAKAQELAQQVADARTAQISATFEKGLASLRAGGKTTDTKVANEILQKVYTQCVLPDSGRVLLDSGADSLNAAAGLGAAVPADSAPAPKPAGQNGHGGSVPSSRSFDDAVRGVRAQAEATGASGHTAPATK